MPVFTFISTRRMVSGESHVLVHAVRASNLQAAQERYHALVGGDPEIEIILGIESDQATRFEQLDATLN